MEPLSSLHLLAEAVRNAGADIAPTYQEYIQLARRRSLPLGAAALCGAAAASGVELGVGLACRYLLHLAVWDYSALWGNVAGLVCPLYSFYWFLLCFWVLLVLRGAENLTERPLYRITKWAAEP